MESAALATPVASMKWCDLRFTVPGPKEVLAGVSGQLLPGELACILGPSGAGKSTLLNVIGGRQRTSGNGYELSGFIELGDQVLRPDEMRKRVAFVMQDDALTSTQTVRESLMFSSALKLPGVSAQQRAVNVEGLLTSLGLESCADTRIGSALVKGISGGERKRASVGVELITNPMLILLDEPTSGLDSFAAAQLAKLLKQLAQNGRIVCSTIHQPSSEVFELFDRVMCLRKGAMLYQGAHGMLLKALAARQVPCPEGYNAADWLLNLAQTRDDLAAMDDLLDADSTLRQGSSGSHVPGARAQLPVEVPRAGFWTQVNYLTRREFSNVLRDKKALGARMGTTVGQAVLYAIIFPGVAKSVGDLEAMAQEAGPFAAQKVISESVGNEFGALVGLSIAAFFGASQPLLLSFPLERPVFLREYSSNMYSVVSYFLSKTIVELLVTFIQNLLLFLITYWALNLRANFFELLFATWTMAISASSMALWLGCVVSSASTAIQLQPAMAVPQILFSGLFLKSNQLKVYLRWIQYICSLKYAINLLCIGEYGGLELDIKVGETTVHYRGTDFLEGQDIHKDQWWLYVAVLLAIFVVFRVLAMVALEKKARYVF